MRPSRTLRVLVEVFVALAGVATIAWAWRIDRRWYEHHLIWRYCAVDPGELAHVSAWRWGGVAAGMALALVARPLAGRWVARHGPLELARQFVWFAALSTLMLLAANTILRRFGVTEHDRPRAAFVVDDLHLGWRNAPNTTTVLPYFGPFGVKTVAHTNDAFGNRVGSPSDVTDPTLPTVIFNGESITYGLGLEYPRTYPARVGDILGVQAANLAVSAYSVDQVYVRLTEELARFQRPVAVVTLVVPVQLIRLEVDRPFFFRPLDDGGVEEVRTYNPLWRWSSLHRLFATTVGYQSDEPIEVARATFAATARAARARGAYPLFVLSHWGPQCLPDETGAPSIEHPLFDGLDVDHVRVDLDPSWWDASTDHPDARAHEHLADVIARALRATVVASR